MKLKVLLAETDEEWANSIKDSFEKFNYDIDHVTTGADAQKNLYNNKYFAVIINFDIKNHPTMQVLKFIHSNYRGQKVILVFNNDKIMKEEEIEPDSLLKLGVLEYVEKPISNEDLKSVLEGHQSFGELISSLDKKDGTTDEVELELMDTKFSKARIEEFYSPVQVLFDVFVKLSENHYVKILHAGDKFSKERVDKYKNEKNIKQLYFLKTDRRKYVQFYNHLSKKLDKNENVGTKLKTDVLRNTVDKFVEEGFEKGIKPTVVAQGKEICESVYNVINKQKDLWKLLREYEELDPDIFTHTYMVTLYSSCIIKQFDWQSRSTIESVALASMLHDIGKLGFKNRDLIEKDPATLTDEEFAQYKHHPTYGVALTRNNQLVSHVVQQTILQHHESFDGKGFPNGTKRENILTLANIIGISDGFAHILSREKIAPLVAVRKLLTDKDSVSKYNSEVVEAFIKIFAEPVGKAKSKALPANSRVVKK